MQASGRISKHTVLSSGLQDADIRPPALLGEFRRLSIRDAEIFFADQTHMKHSDCPACGKNEADYAFAKNGFSYAQCTSCDSVYVSPRPDEETLQRYQLESEASHYRTAQFADGTAPQRREHLLRSYAQWMGSLAEGFDAPERPTYADYQNHLPALFEEVAALEVFGQLFSIEPRGLPAPGIARMTGPGDGVQVDCVSAFEKLEHQFSPHAFLQTLHACLNPGGLLFLTTRTCSGFDLQVLGGNAPYIFVPEHLNLLSIAGLEMLLQQSGFELVELSTPGQLDVELVRQACADNPSIVLPPFACELITRRDRRAHADFQEYLQKHRLSSHVRIAARKAQSCP